MPHFEVESTGQIFYDYTYYRLLKKRYSNMTGNDVTYTYGTTGTGRGRITKIEDGAGMQAMAYDALGNVTDETRTIALPQHSEVYRFRMLYEYDSWGRMLTMTYPDNEKITYTYQWGGDPTPRMFDTVPSVWICNPDLDQRDYYFSHNNSNMGKCITF